VKTLVGVAEAGIVLSWGERAQRVVLDDHEGGTAARMSPVNPRLWRAAERGHSAAWGKLARYSRPRHPAWGDWAFLGPSGGDDAGMTADPTRTPVAISLAPTIPARPTGLMRPDGRKPCARTWNGSAPLGTPARPLGTATRSMAI